MKPIHLLMDTSQEYAILALFSEGKTMEQLCLPHHNNLCDKLMPEIDALFSKHKLSLENLTTIFTGIGPGSYTGIRTALSIASCLALPYHTPLYPFCSLLLYLPPLPIEGPLTLLYPGKTTHFLWEGTIQQGEITAPSKHTLLDPSTQIPPHITLSPTPHLPPIFPYLEKLRLQPPDPLTIHYLSAIP